MSEQVRPELSLLGSREQSGRGGPPKLLMFGLRSGRSSWEPDCLPEPHDQVEPGRGMFNARDLGFSVEEVHFARLASGCHTWA